MRGGGTVVSAAPPHRVINDARRPSHDWPPYVLPPRAADGRCRGGCCQPPLCNANARTECPRFPIYGRSVTATRLAATAPGVRRALGPTVPKSHRPPPSTHTPVAEAMQPLIETNRVMRQPPESSSTTRTFILANPTTRSTPRHPSWARLSLHWWSFWRSFHQPLLHPTRPHWPESRPNLTCLDPTGTGSAEYGQSSPNQERGGGSSPGSFTEWTSPCRLASRSSSTVHYRTQLFALGSCGAAVGM